MFQGAVVNGAIELAARASALAKNGATNLPNSAATLMRGKSLVSVSNVGRVEPLVLVDADVVNVDYITDVMHSVHAIFSGYYLQAINMVNQVNSVSVHERLAPLNPTHGFESYREGRSRRFGLSKKAIAVAIESDKTSVKTDIKDYDSLSQGANLSVGKLFNVTLKINQDEVVVPVAIRLMVNVLPTTVLSELFTYRDAFDTNLKERWYMYKAGRLGFFKDLILCQDLIAKYRKMAITDQSGVGAKILNREARIVLNSVLGNQSYSTATNIAVISSTTLSGIEAQIGGKFSNSKVRRSIFENTNLMLLVILDKQYERATIYTRDVDLPTTLSVSQMKTANKGSGPDVAEIMKAYMLGSSPQSF
jgi:hypothetical protein